MVVLAHVLLREWQRSSGSPAVRQILAPDWRSPLCLGNDRGACIKRASNSPCTGTGMGRPGTLSTSGQVQRDLRRLVRPLPEQSRPRAEPREVCPTSQDEVL